jgi:guanosine-3',5'-bis(diphosphate) 3'-pyrophosphohydrolase
VSHFNELRDELLTYLDDEKVAIIHRAYQLAAQAHTGQHRCTGDPYIVHPIAVATILCQMRMDYQSIAAAILHDVIEDTCVKKAQIIEQFGAEIADLVDGVSKLAHIPFENQAQAQAANFRKMILAMGRDIRVILIKLADRLHNMRTLAILPPEKKIRIAKETLDIYAPIAARLGMHRFSTELEDVCLEMLHPMRYRVIQEAINKLNRARKQTISHIETNIKALLEQKDFPSCVVWHRQSHLYGIYRRMREQRQHFADIMDNLDFRIVTDKIDTCYRVLGAVHQVYKPFPSCFKDYIASPKKNGYQALHTSLFGPHGMPIGIQIRTADMDNVSENGITAFGFYKSGDLLNEVQFRANVWLKDLMEIQENTRGPLEFIEHVKTDLFPVEIYVFTPQGKIMELPRGATVVDFAYAVHSDIGSACVAAKIDRKFASLSTELSNGQTIEIITSPNARPNISWLNFVVTGKAKSNIRHYLKDKKRDDSVSLGKALLERALSAQKVNLQAISAHKMHAVLKYLECKSPEDLYAAIGLGQKIAPLVAQHLLSENFETEAIELATLQEPYVIKGSEGIVIRFASCCRPIPGDPIAGIVRLNKGMTVHHETCKKLDKWRHRLGRYVALSWEDNITQYFKVELDIEVNNQQGIIAKITTVIAETKANLLDIQIIRQDDYHGVIHLLLSVYDRVHLAAILRRARSINGITKMSRSKP